MQRNIPLFTFVVVCVFLFAACSAGGAGDTSYQSILWQIDGNGDYQLKTNDPQYCNGTFYKYMADEIVMDTAEIECRRVSGYSHMGYGLVFCYDSSTDVRYRMLITVNGSYKISEMYKDGDSYSYNTLVDWTSSGGAINTGYDMSNTLKVVWDSGSSNFDFYINDIFIVSLPLANFTNQRTGGQIGFIAPIGSESQESFPQTPVDYRFKLLQP